MATVLSTRPYHRGEQIADSVTHGVGLLLAVAALSVLVTNAAFKGDAWHIVSCSLYGASLVLLYASSTLYHSLVHTRAAGKLRVLDHATIYLLIAGSYTPFLLVNLRGPWGWSLFGVIWGMAAIGVTMKIFFTGRWNRLSTALYLVMGWTAVIMAGPLIRNVDGTGLAWLLMGGLFYSGGVYFFIQDKKPYYHAIWHGFVMAGSACHFFSIYYGVLPPFAS